MKQKLIGPVEWATINFWFRVFQSQCFDETKLMPCQKDKIQLRLFQAQSGSGGLVVSSDEKRREELRWFPADNISDCDAEPGLEQVKHTKLNHWLGFDIWILETQITRTQKAQKRNPTNWEV